MATALKDIEPAPKPKKAARAKAAQYENPLEMIAARLKYLGDNFDDLNDVARTKPDDTHAYHYSKFEGLYYDERETLLFQAPHFPIQTPADALVIVATIANSSHPFLNDIECILEDPKGGPTKEGFRDLLHHAQAIHLAAYRLVAWIEETHQIKREAVIGEEAIARRLDPFDLTEGGGSE